MKKDEVGYETFEYNYDDFKSAIGRSEKEAEQLWEDFKEYSEKKAEKGFPSSEFFESWCRKKNCLRRHASKGKIDGAV